MLNPGGIAISTAAHSQVSPAVAANGTDWLVAWQDGRGSTEHIYGARVNPSGLVLNPTGIAICVATNSQGSPAVAAADTNWLVVWQDARTVAATGSDICAVRVNASGLVADTTALAINMSVGEQQSPAIAALNGQYLVVYDGPAETGVRRIRAHLLSRPQPIPLTIRPVGKTVVLIWTNSAFALQSAPLVTGVFTNVPGAVSPHTNPVGGSHRFFRLIGN